jgi:hypothetical protein
MTDQSDTSGQIENPLKQIEALRQKAMKGWCKRDLWTVQDACRLIMGLIPDGTPENVFRKTMRGTQYETLVACAEAAITARTLKPFSLAESHKVWRSQMVRPGDFLRWAKAKDFRISEELMALLDEPEPEPAEQAKPFPDGERALGTRERRTLLVIIEALAKEANIDTGSPYAAAETIKALTEQLGAPISQDTIANRLKEIPDALEAKQKS